MTIKKCLSFLLVAILSTCFISCGDDDDTNTNQNLSQENGNYFVCGSAFSEDVLNLFDITQAIVVDGDTLAKTDCTKETSSASMTCNDTIPCYMFRTYAYTSSRPVEICVKASLKSSVASENLPSKVDFVYYSNFGQIESEPNSSTWASINAQASLFKILGFDLTTDANKDKTTILNNLKIQASIIETYKTIY